MFQPSNFRLMWCQLLMSSISAKPIGSQWFKVLLEFLVFTCIFYFHKMMKFYIAIFSAWISSTSAKHFFSQKHNRSMFDLMKFTFMDLFWLFGFWQESHRFYISIFKKLHIIYQYLLPTSHATFRENFTWCYYQPPLEDLIFGPWERFDYLNF